MKLDDFTLAFNCPGCPSWGTAIVEQDKNKIHLVKQSAINVITGIIHKCGEIGTHDFAIPIGKGGRLYYGDTGFDDATSEPLLVAQFDNVYINEIRINHPFILALIRDKATDHVGRLQVKYTPKLKYGEVTNEAFFEIARVQLGISADEPWSFVDLDIRNQDDLCFISANDKDIERLKNKIDTIKERLGYVDETENRKRAFHEYLTTPGRFKADETGESYWKVISSDRKEIQFLKPIVAQITGDRTNDIFQVSDVDEATRIWEMVKPLPENQSFQGSIVSAILNKYKDFLSNYKRKISSIVTVGHRIPEYRPGEVLQQVFFGAPGTSKSTYIKRFVGNKEQHRVTFHPDTDYAGFVGCYKPTKDDGKDNITYDFVAQAFVKAYVSAWKKLYDESELSKEVFLVIEEINRGNCAQIFGDLFQLLDRDDNGYSDYSIEPDTDLAKYLAKEFKDSSIENQSIKDGKSMMLPPNLYIWATMNTSDQSLFPIDSAFKRRWEWKYTPIRNAKKNHLIKLSDRQYDWWEFVEAVNKRIEKVTESEDKQIGYWFAKPENGVSISAERFVSKVIFYLWNDVFKDYGNDPNSPFVVKLDDSKKVELRFKSFFNEEGNIDEATLIQFLWGLKLETKAAVPVEETNETQNNSLEINAEEETEAEPITESADSVDIDDDDEVPTPGEIQNFLNN